jgi:hypothetical protein
MRFLLLLLCFSLLSLDSFAKEELSQCEVRSRKHPELTRGINKKVICREVRLALTQSYKPYPEGTNTVVRISDREMYSVGLKIKCFVDGELEYKGTGRMHWFPGDSFVVIDE